MKILFKKLPKKGVSYWGVICWMMISSALNAHQPTLYFWSPDSDCENFGDHLSQIIVEKILDRDVPHTHDAAYSGKKLLAIGSILQFAKNKDVVWGSGVNGKDLDPSNYSFEKINIRAVRGPLTRKFFRRNFGIKAPRVYGDPALLLPILFPELKKAKNPSREFIFIPHISEEALFPKSKYPYVVYPTEHWSKILEKVLDSKLVISSSLHGIVVAEAFGVPARLYRPTHNEPLFKYEDYYRGTGRRKFQEAKSLEQAHQLGGEPPHQCNLKKLYNAFPFDKFKKKRSSKQSTSALVHK